MQKSPRRRLKFTEKRVAKFVGLDSRGTQYHDTECVGFGATVFPRPSRGAPRRGVYWVVYQRPTGKGRRRYHLGDIGTKPVDEYRDDARAILARVAAGEDPAAERERRKQVPIVAEWVEEYMAGVRLRKKRPQHDEGYMRMLSAEFGNESIDSLGAGDIEHVMRRYAEKLKLRDGKVHTTAPNRMLASIRACLASAWRLGLIPVNPAMRVMRLKENTPRSRVLDDEELRRLLVTLETWPRPYERAAFMMLVQTGARLSEVLHAKWQDVDFDGRTWAIPSPKSGHRQVVPLPPGLAPVLRRLERLGEYVIPGTANPNRPRYDLKGPWTAIKKAAGLPNDVHVHDLRRTYGLRLARLAGLHVASKLLRHGDVKTTERVYVPLGLESDLRPAAQDFSIGLGKLLQMKPKKAAG